MQSNNPDKEKSLQKYNILFEQVAQAPSSPRLLARLGDVCLELGRREEALLHYKKALRLAPDFEGLAKKINENFNEAELKDVEFSRKTLPFWQNFVAVVRYPFAKQGIIVILAGAILFTILDLLSMLPLIGFLFFIIQFFIVFPYILAYMLKIIRSTANGRRELPDWPEFSDYWESIYRPFVQIFFTLSVSFIPVLFVLILPLLGIPELLVLLPVCIILGIIYFPMALIAVAIYDNIWSPLNVSLILGSIWKVKKHYFLALLTIGIFIFIEYIIRLFVLGQIPIVGPFIHWMITLYFIAVQMYILGNVYYINRAKLRWF